MGSNPRAIMRSRDASSAVVKLVETSGYEPMQSSSLTPEQIKQELFQTYKDISITDEDIYNYIQFGDTTAKKLIETKDMDISSLVLENPVAYVMGVNEGDILKYKSCQIEVKSVINSENGGKVILLDLDGEDLMIKFNPKNIVSSVEAPIILAESIEGGFGPNQAGELLEISKSVGESVEAGDTLFVIEALKQKSEVKATTSGKVIKVSDKLNGAPVKKGEWILTV